MSARRRVKVMVEVFATPEWLEDRGAFVDGARDVVWDYLDDTLAKLEDDDFSATVVGVEVSR